MHMNRTRSRLIGRLLMASMLFGCFLRAPAPAAQRWKPDIPKVWDEAALADWATPVAGLNLRPTHISAKEYYSLKVENLRTYPVYFPGREPDGYWEMLRQVGPKPLIEPNELQTEADWIEAGRTVFEQGGSPAPAHAGSHVCRRRQESRDVRPGRRRTAAGRDGVRLAVGADEAGCGAVVRKLQQLPSRVHVRRHPRRGRLVVRRGLTHAQS